MTGATANKKVSATGREEEPLEDLMENASPDFKDVVVRLEEWAKVRGYKWQPKEKSRRRSPGSGARNMGTG